MVDVKTSSTTTKVSVSTKGTSGAVTTLNNMSAYYSDLAKKWAISSEIVNNEDYSSKYYAQQSKESAEKAEAANENVTEATDEIIAEITTAGETQLEALSTQYTTYSETLAAAQETAITEINTLTTDFETLSSTKTSEYTALATEKETDLNTDFTTYTTDLKTTQNTALSAITTAQTTATTAVETAQSTAETAIDTATEEAKTEIDEYAKATFPDVSIYATKTELDTKADSSDVYTKDEIDGKLASAMHYKGTVDTVDDLPSAAETGDVYNVTETGDNYAYDGTTWDKLAGVVDLSAYLTSETAASTYSTKAELTEVEAKIPDISDLAEKSEIPTLVSQLTNDSGYLTAVPDEYITETELDAKGYLTEHQDISGKQDVISDLDTIRAGAALGTTALQSVPDEYITETELDAKGYLTEHQDISNLATKTELEAKQDILTAGDNITIVDNVISASGTSASTTYTAGDGITITDNAIAVDTTVVATQTDLAAKQDAGNYVEKTDLADRTVLGTTKTIQSIDGEQLYFPNGAIFGGTAAAAGLVTRGICGVVTPFTSGDGKKYVYKENLFINYDGNNTYTRQLVLAAADTGDKIDNTTNGYTYCAIRGDDMVQYVTASIDTAVGDISTVLDTINGESV